MQKKDIRDLYPQATEELEKTKNERGYYRYKEISHYYLSNWLLHHKIAEMVNREQT